MRIAFLALSYLFVLSTCQPKVADTTSNSPSISTPDAPSNNGIYKINDYVKGKGYEKYAQATFAGGCFWCTEASFECLIGVEDVISGYSGGDKAYPTYKEVGQSNTGHTEAIHIYYDAEKISFSTLLDVLFVAHDGTQVNRQGPDVGPEYRSAVYYHNDEQKSILTAKIAQLNTSGELMQPIATEVAPYKEFWTAEAYHQDYYIHHPDNPYVQRISTPKVKKVEKIFKEILKKDCH